MNYYHMSKRNQIKLFLCTLLLCCSIVVLGNYGVNSSSAWFSDPSVTDFAIFFIGKDGSDLGGIRMDKNNSEFTLGFDHGHIAANKGWNQYKFVYMTAAGQKETEWIFRDSNPNPGDTEKPTVPSSLTTSNITENSVILNWIASTDNVGVVGYEVYKDGSKIADVSGTNYSVTGLAPDTQYSFNVKASDAVPNTSNACIPVSVRTNNSNQPTANYGVDTTHAWFSDPAVTDFAIFFIGKNGADLGGIGMNKNGSEFTLALDHGHITANSDWNRYKFVYMTAAGQKETDWISRSSTPNPTLNNNPVAVNDSEQITSGLSAAIDVLVNDSDPDGDILFIEEIVQSPQNGTAVINANRIEYTHNGSNSENDSFSYSIHDGNGGSAVATVILTITSTVNNNPNLFPVKIVNNTGRPDNQVYVTFIGRFPEEGRRNTMARLNFDTSELAPIKMSDNDPQNDDKCTSYYKKLSELTQVTENIYSFDVPRIASARMYISVDKPVYFHVNEEPGGLAEPNVLADGEVKSGYDTIYDIIEITWLHDQDLFVNTSNVDFLSIPFKIQMNMEDGSQVVRGYDISRNEIFTLAENMGEPWSSCIVRNESGEPIRLLGGTLGTVAEIIPIDYLQPAIDSAWEYFKTVPIDTAFEGWDIGNGLVGSNDELAITASHNAYGSQTFTIAKPTSREGFASEGSLASGSIIERKIQAFIGAAINRGILHNTDSWWNRNDYYKNSYWNSGFYNKYAELLHSVAIDGRCYGFSYDDVNGLDSSIWMPNEKELIITIPDLNVSIPTNEPPVPDPTALNYGVNSTNAWLNDPSVTGFAIFFIGKDGANLGGIQMNKNSGEFTLGLDHGHIVANKGWNQYKFVYMTAAGQKETDWISK